MKFEVEMLATERGGTELSGMERPGAYIVLASDKETNGASAVFMVASTEGKNAIVFRAAMIPGFSKENLHLVWLSSEKPRLVYMTPPQDEGNRTFEVTVISHDSFKQE